MDFYIGRVENGKNGRLSEAKSRKHCLAGKKWKIGRIKKKRRMEKGKIKTEDGKIGRNKKQL